MSSTDASGDPQTIMFFSRFEVVGHSMEPVFKDGDRLIINRLTYRFKKPAAGDIVAARHPKERNKILLKKIKDILPDNKYYIVGLNENDSEDSRRFGPISKDLIIGKVWFNY